MNIDLTGQVAMITGGGKGIGRHIALALAQAGTDVILIGRDAQALEEAASEAQKHGVQAHTVVADITRPETLEPLTTLIESRYHGQIDIVVTAAGTRDHMAQPVADIDIAAFDAVMQGNLNGTLNPIKAVLPAMIRRKQGKIITISGVFGLRGKAHHAAGCASKWALEGLTRVMALELGPHNINVNAICPGYVEGPRSETGLRKAAERQGVDEATLRKKLVDATALKRLSTPDDIAHATLFLASSYARNITGQDIVIDAGWTL